MQDAAGLVGGEEIAIVVVMLQVMLAVEESHDTLPIVTGGHVRSV